MTGLIEAFQFVDQKLVKSLDAKLEPILILEDVETSSLKAFLRNALAAADDEALKKLDWKGVVGPYLVKAKYLMIDFLDKRATITNRMEILDLQKQLLAAAEETEMAPIPVYAPIPEADLVESLRIISEPIARLSAGDSAKYITAEDEASFNVGFTMPVDAIRDLLTKETISNPNQIMILKVKRPDYLGDAMWDFKYEGSPFTAKIMDSQWLRDFQERKKDVRPGDALRAEVQIDVRYGFDGEVIGKNCSITKVIEIIRIDVPIQTPLPPF